MEEPMNTLLSPNARLALEIASKNHWRFQILDETGMINQPIYQDGWWYEPVNVVPIEVEEKVWALRKSIPIVGIIKGHEAPKLLPAPEQSPKDDFRIDTSGIRFFKLMEYLIRVFRFFTPWVTRVFWFTVSLFVTTLWSFWRGVPQTVSDIANDWLTRAAIAGFPTVWDRRLYQVLWVIALLTIILGWVLLSYITVWVTQQIF
jgi:hypothetical protein